MIDVVVKNGSIITMNKSREILNDMALIIDKGIIIDICKSNQVEEKYPDVIRTIDAEGKAIFPGLINTHTHLFQSLLKGLGDDRVLSDWLVNVMFPSAAKITQNDAYYGAMLGCVDGIRSGTTTVLDYMHAHPSAELADGVIDAFNKTGIRGILGRGYMDNGGDFGTPSDIMQDVDTIEKDCVRLLDKYHNSSNNRIKVWIAPAAVWLSSKEGLHMSKRLADAYKTGITVHVSETPFDREATKHLHGSFDTDYLAEQGILGDNVLLVHCVHLTQKDIRMIKYYDSKVSHNPISNMYLSSGVAPVPQLIQAGVNVSIATDGAASNNSNDMLEVLKATALLHKVHNLDPTIITAEKVLEMATIDGAKAVGLQDKIGSLEIGKRADLFVFNPMSSVKAVPMHNPVSTLVYSSNQNNIETVIIDGNIVLDEGRFEFDEQSLLRQAQKISDDLSVRAQTDKLKNRPWRSLAY